MPPSKCYTPIANGNHPETGITYELKGERVQDYQELIGTPRWSVKIGQVNILFEISLLSKYLITPRQGHLDQVIHIFGYIKIYKILRLLFYCGDPRHTDSRFKEYD